MLTSLALAGSSCHSGDPVPLCGVRQQVELAASTLTLSANAVVEPMGSGFFLRGVDTDGNTVRWAELSATGALGPEQAAALPAHEPSLGPWVTLAGSAAPFDRVVAFYAAPSSADPQVLSLWSSSFPRLGMGDAGAAGAPQELVPLPGPTPSLRVTAGSGRGGRRAGVAFGLSGVESFTFLSVDGAGRMVGPAQTVAGGASAQDFKCLQVSSVPGGTSDLTLSYVRQSSDLDPSPVWQFFGVDTNGLVGGMTSMSLAAMNPSCPVMTLSDEDVVLAWEDPRSAWFVTWSPRVSQLNPQRIDAASAQPGGMLRPLVGVGPLSKGFGVLFQGSRGGALRVVDALGGSVQSEVALPARSGQVGKVSAVSIGSSLYASYADYESAAAAGGRRQFLRLGCE